MIQTNPRIKYFSGLNLDMEPKDTSKPNGSAITSVNAKISHVTRKPLPKFKKSALIMLYLSSKQVSLVL